MAFGHPHDLLVAADRGGAHPGALASLVAVGGFVCLFAWVAWRFGPTLMRFCGIASWWAGWACGSQGGYGYMVFLLILGTARLERGDDLVPRAARLLAVTTLPAHLQPRVRRADPRRGAQLHPLPGPLSAQRT